MTRWTVEKQRDQDDVLPSGWHAISPTGKATWFDCHATAVDYADAMARTVTVTTPRIELETYPFSIEFVRDALVKITVFGQNDFWEFTTQGVESIRNAAIELLGFYAACKQRGWQ